MKCNICGRELADDVVFCSYCGVKIEPDKLNPPVTKRAEKKYKNKHLNSRMQLKVAYKGIISDVSHYFYSISFVL